MHGATKTVKHAISGITAGHANITAVATAAERVRAAVQSPTFKVKSDRPTDEARKAFLCINVHRMGIERIVWAAWCALDGVDQWLQAFAQWRKDAFHVLGRATRFKAIGKRIPALSCAAIPAEAISLLLVEVDDLLKPRAKPCKVARLASLRPFVLGNAGNRGQFLNERSRKLGGTLPVATEFTNVHSIRVRLRKVCGCFRCCLKELAQSLVSGHAVLKPRQLRELPSAVREAAVRHHRLLVPTKDRCSASQDPGFTGQLSGSNDCGM